MPGEVAPSSLQKGFWVLRFRVQGLGLQEHHLPGDVAPRSLRTADTAQSPSTVYWHVSPLYTALLSSKICVSFPLQRKCYRGHYVIYM